MTSLLPPDPYKILRVAKDVKLPELRRAHRKLVLKYHPDMVQDAALKAVARDEFQKVQQAYEILSDETRRLQYDKQAQLFKLRKELGRRHKMEESDYRDFAGRYMQAARRKSAVEGDSHRPHPGMRRASNNDYPPRKEEKARQSRRDELGLQETERVRWNTERVRPLSRPRKIPTGILVVQGHINGRESYAIPDTGTNGNIIAAAFARDLGLTVQDQDHSQRQLLRIANGKHIPTIGIVQARWSFTSDPSQKWQIAFHVLADSVYDLIIGSHFLCATQTMSHHQHRLCRVSRPLTALSVLRVNILGAASQRVRGTLQRRMVHALPDSGSEPNLLSLEYVKRREWSAKIELEDQNMLQFADGSIGRTEGSIWARWRFGKADEKGVWVKFHVLRGCPYNVILGQDMLEETDAFLRYEKVFLIVKSNEEPSGLNLVIWLPKKERKPSSRTSGRNQSDTPILAPSRESEGLHTELQRRAAADRKISRMPNGNEREAASAAEEDMRRAFDSRESSAQVTTTS